MRPVADALAAAYPGVIRPEHVDLLAYLSAVELLYLHALEARRPLALSYLPGLLDPLHKLREAGA